MSALSESTPPKSTLDGSLGEILRRTAYAQLPSRFHTLSQLGFPLAYQLFVWGWPRAAGWSAFLALFGLWALVEQHLKGHADSLTPPAADNPRTSRVWRIVRGGVAVAGSVLALGLVLEAFVQIMAIVFKCPGCAG